MGLPLGHPAFQAVADARRLMKDKSIVFSTPEAREMLHGCLQIIDQQQRAVEQFDRTLWDGGKAFGWRYGLFVGGLVGLVVGVVTVRLLS